MIEEQIKNKNSKIGKSLYVGITFLVSIQASGFLQQKHPKCWDSTSSYVGITVSSLFLGIKIFQKKAGNIQFISRHHAKLTILTSLCTVERKIISTNFAVLDTKKLLSTEVVFLPTLTKYLQKSQILSALQEEVAKQSAE